MKKLFLLTVFPIFTYSQALAGNVICQAARADGTAFADNTTSFQPIGGWLGAADGTAETRAQTTYRTPGTFSKAGAYVTQNDISTASTVKLRVNAATVNISISCTGNTTGLFEDTTHSDTIVAGDKINFLITAPSVAGSHTITISGIFCKFSASTNTTEKLIACRPAQTYSGSTETFLGLGTDLHISGTTESVTQYTYRSDGTLANGFAHVSVNTHAGGATLRSRVNTANGNIAVSITASTTGFFEDTSNTDTISSGALISMSIKGGAGAGSMSIDVIGMEFTTTNSKSHAYITYDTGTAFSLNTTYYQPIAGGGVDNSGNTSTEARLQYKAGFPFTASNLETYVTANTSASSDTFDFRINSVSSSLTTSIAALTTGLFEDSLNTASVVIGDLVNYRLVVGISAGISVSQEGCMITDTTVASTVKQLAALGVG